MDNLDFANLTSAQLREFKERGGRGEYADITFCFNTGLLVQHKYAKLIAFEIQRRGFQILNQGDDSGRMYRRHFIVYRGNAWEAAKLAMDLTETIRKWEKEND